MACDAGQFETTCIDEEGGHCIFASCLVWSFYFIVRIIQFYTFLWFMQCQSTFTFDDNLPLYLLCIFVFYSLQFMFHFMISSFCLAFFCSLSELRRSQLSQSFIQICLQVMFKKYEVIWWLQIQRGNGFNSLAGQNNKLKILFCNPFIAN